MAITILGENIDLIRPRKILKPQLPKEPWKPLYNKRPKTRILGAAEFFAFCLSFKRQFPKPVPWGR